MDTQIIQLKAANIWGEVEQVPALLMPSLLHSPPKIPNGPAWPLMYEYLLVSTETPI